MTSAGLPAPPDVDGVPFADGLLLHHRVHRTVHVLNASAAALWLDAAGHPGSDDEATVARVAAAHGVPAGEVVAGARATLDELRAAGLLEGEATGDPSDRPAGRDASSDRSDRPRAPVATADLGPFAALHRTAAVLGPPEAVDGLRDLLTALPRRPDAEQAYRLRPDGGDWRLLLGDAPLHGPASLAACQRHLLWHLNHQAIADERTWLLLHAGAVGGPAGAVAIAGEPDAGKSTLTAAACQRGLRYLTDEATAVDPAGHVHPYPKPLSLDATSLELLDLPAGAATAGHVAPGAVGAPGVAPEPLAAVVLPERRPGAPTRLRRLDPPAAALALAATAFNLPATGADGLALLARLAERIPVHALVVGSLAEAGDVVVQLAGGPA